MAMLDRSERQQRTNPQRGILSRRQGFGEQESPWGGEQLFFMNPFSLMKRVTDEMNRAFGQSGGEEVGFNWSPAVEVTQDKGKLAVSAELPGLKPEDVKITVEDDMLVLEGERVDRKEEGEGRVRRSEIRYGRFYRAIPLPDGAQTEQAQAKFENGVLRIEVPVAEEAAKRRQIPITGQTGDTVQTGTTGETGGRKAA